jgi:5'-3' exonuclease
MGIPVYFKTIVDEYQNLILKKDKLLNCQSLFLDLNCAIHPCCHGETDETIMIQKIIQKIENLISYTNVQQLLYIAIDGIPPKGKMKQQRMRRFKSVLEEKLWDTNSISPGTYFMDKLNYSIREWISQKNQSNLKIIFSDSNERGEGEHKILQFIKKNHFDNYVIYGLDADLIMLSIVSNKDNIHLLRERTEYNIENTENEYIYLLIDQLKQHIQKEIPNINDYIFICFFLGNDFINHLHSLSLRYKGYDLLIDTYKLLNERYQGYFYLIDTNLEYCIHLTFLKEFIYELSLKEKNLNNFKNKIREKQYKNINNKYHELFTDFKSKYEIKNELINLNDIYEYQKVCSLDNDKCKEMINNLPILYYPLEIKTNHKSNSEICHDYINSLIWTTNYYFKECVNWKWCTEYDQTPSLKELYNYISKLDNLSFQKDNDEYSIKDLLSFIFPNESHKLHNYKIKNINYDMKINVLHHRYLWECPILFKFN